MQARATAGVFLDYGDCQQVSFMWKNETTDDVQTNLYLSSSSPIKLVIWEDTILAGILNVTGCNMGGDVSHFVRKVMIKRIDDGGVDSVTVDESTVGTDLVHGTTDLTVMANNTDKSLQILVTGIDGELWFWSASFEGLKMARADTEF